MNATSTSPGPSVLPGGAGETSGGRSRPDRSILALVVAGVLVVGVVVLVLLFGVARPPELPALADRPDPAPSGGIAWIVFDEEGDCLSVAWPDAAVERVMCEPSLGQLLAWDDDGVVVATWGAREELRWIDPRNGEEVRREPTADRHDLDPWEGDRIASRHVDGVLTVTRQDTQEVVWTVAAPQAYSVHLGTVSPDGAWVAMVDSASRLLVVLADGSAPPRVWTEDATPWEPPIWEGTPLGGDGP